MTQHHCLVPVHPVRFTTVTCSLGMLLHADVASGLRRSELRGAPCCLAGLNDLLQQDGVGHFPLPVCWRCECRVCQELIEGPQL